MADKKISALTGATTPLAGTEVLPIVQSGATVKVAVSDLTAGRAVSALSLASTTGATFATTSGSVGIKTASPEATLDLGGSTASAVQQIFGRGPGATDFSVRYTNGAAGTNAFIGTLGLDYANGVWADMAAIKFYRNSVAGELAFFASAPAASGTEQMRVTSTGVTVTSGNLVIGTAGKGIDFSVTSSGSGTMTSELLADYEEGTWTPAFVGTGTLTTVTYAGVYTKIGRMVNCTASIDVADWGTFSALAYISGLPFTANASYPTPTIVLRETYALGYMGSGQVTNPDRIQDATYYNNASILAAGTSRRVYVISLSYSV